MAPETRTRSSTDPFLELDEASSIVVIPGEGELRLPSVFEDSAKQESTSLAKSKTEIVVAVKIALSDKDLLP